jgi:hypothetical protein
MNIPQAQIELIAAEAAKKAVKETLLTLGIDADNPLAAQKDMMVLREVGDLIMDAEFRKDMEHLRTWRVTLNGVKSKGLLTLVGLIVTGVVGLTMAGFQGWLGGK